MFVRVVVVVVVFEFVGVVLGYEVVVYCDGLIG